VSDIDRDRDDSGRARNARPRDGLGRPLPRGSASGAERVPDDLTMSVDDAITLAQRYLDAGQPFHAHEVLEALWKTRPASERDLWQGLAQLAVGLTHALRGNSVGAVTLLRRGAGRVESYSGNDHGVDVAGVLSFSFGVANELADGIAVHADDVVLRLRPTATHNA
jgi:hypothetical protein